MTTKVKFEVCAGAMIQYCPRGSTVKFINPNAKSHLFLKGDNIRDADNKYLFPGLTPDQFYHLAQLLALLNGLYCELVPVGQGVTTYQFKVD